MKIKMKRISILVLFIISNFILNAQENSKNITFQMHDIADFNGASDVQVVDIDNDGNNDIVGTSYHAGICWWKNDGNENFTKNQISSAYNEPLARCVRATLHDGSILDFNGDGFADLVAATMNKNKVSIWTNDGDGTFTQTKIDEESIGAHTVDVTDIDEDGDIDILIASFGNTTEDGEFAIYYNNGNLQFSKTILHKTLNSCGTFIYADNIDDDSEKEILFVEYIWNAPSDLGYYKKTGDSYEKVIVDSYKGFHTALLKDYDQDGDLDILAAAYNDHTFLIYDNNGRGNFTKKWESFGRGASWLDMADFDNDGDNDLVGAAHNSLSNPDLLWFENDGAFNFTVKTLISNIAEIQCAIPSDIDNDGDKDIIIMATAGNKMIWWENINSPIDISLSSNSIDENSTGNTFVSKLSSIDANQSDTHSYNLVEGNGDNHNNIFDIIQDSLFAITEINYEELNTCNVRIRSTDKENLYFEKEFQINVHNVNDIPTGVSISNTVIAENEPVGTLIGLLSADDEDAEDTHLYSITSTNGNENAFNINGSSLLSNGVFNYELDSSYNITIKAVDSEGLFVEKDFIIKVSIAGETYTKELENVLDLQIYPNPFSESTIIKFNNEGHKEYTLILYDISGRIKLQKMNLKENTIKINKGELESGIYYVELIGEKIFKGKLVVE